MDAHYVCILRDVILYRADRVLWAAGARHRTLGTLPLSTRPVFLGGGQTRCILPDEYTGVQKKYGSSCTQMSSGKCPGYIVTNRMLACRTNQYHFWRMPVW